MEYMGKSTNGTGLNGQGYNGVYGLATGAGAGVCWSMLEMDMVFLQIVYTIMVCMP